MKELLLELSEIPGVSGYEDEVREKIKEKLEGVVDEVRVDRAGNLIGLKKGEGKGSIMIATHMDEIGLMVTKIEKGFLRFTHTGFDLRVLPGQEVVIHGKKKIHGVVGAIPPHLTGKKREPYKSEDLFIDPCMPEEEVEHWIRPGDVVSIKRKPVELKGGKIAGKALDNRASCTVLIEILKSLKTHPFDVYGVFTVQEEETGLGAVTGTYSITPTCAVAMDVTHAKTQDAPFLTFTPGKGPVIGVGPNFHPFMVQKLKETAEKEEIPYQTEPIPGPSGTDAWSIQISREGVPTGLVSLPLKYMHTPVEVIDIKDMERAKRLLVRFIESLEEVKIV